MNIIKLISKAFPNTITKLILEYAEYGIYKTKNIIQWDDYIATGFFHNNYIYFIDCESSDRKFCGRFIKISTLTHEYTI